MADKVRVRFAPSPTGGPHVGNIRTAIFDWLLARGSGGSFILRVEDTDQAREVEGSVEELMDALRWLGIDWDEGPDIGGPHAPYVQSQRLDRYRRAAEGLIERGGAYRCHCSSERLAEMRKEQRRLKKQDGYDRRCRFLSEEERLEQESAGVQPVVRFAMPLHGETRLTDLVRGMVVFDNSLVDDFVMLKSDGFPTYHLAHIVDDHAMEITHVLRAEEWLSSAPRHVRLYEALGWEPPLFAHLPVILAPDRSKLSKRHGTTTVLEYREMGYLPQAMVNFLVLLGWSLDDKTEIFSAQELVDSFSLERVSRPGAIFNIDKLNWLNGYYIRQMSDQDLTDALLEFWGRHAPEGIPAQPDRSYLVKIVPLIRERLKTLLDAAPLIPFFFADNVEYDTGQLVQKRMDAEGTRAALSRAAVALSELASFDSDSIEGALRPLADDMGIKVGQLLGSIRVATTGLKVSPPLFESLEVLGRERSLAAIEAAAARL